jgi:peptide deformylase
MPILPIITLPDKRLRAASAPVDKVTPELLSLAQDMLETMYDAPGIGLAAVQVGVMKRLIVLDVAKKEGESKPMIFFNPEIISASEEKSTYKEGCLSIPGIEEEVERPARVRISYMDHEGKTQELEAGGLLATCLQHEIDHTNGKLFIDYLSKLKRDMVMKKFRKLAKNATPPDKSHVL